MEVEQQRKHRFLISDNQAEISPIVEIKKNKLKVFIDLEEAFRVFDDLDEIEDKSTDGISKYLFSNALLLVDAGEYKLASNVLLDLLKREPNHVDALRWMGWCYKSDGDLLQAAVWYEKLILKRCTEQDLFELGDVYYGLKRDIEAQNTWLEALGQCDAESPRLFDLHKCLGNVFMRLGDFESAEENYNKAMVIKANSDILHVNLGSIHLQSKNLIQSMTYFKKAIEINPYNDRAWCGVALVAREKGDLEWSKAVILRSLDINPFNLTALQVLISWSQADQNFQDAIVRVQTYVNKNPNDFDMSYSLAGILFQDGSLKSAEEELVRLENLKSDFIGITELRSLIEKKKSLSVSKES
jgi:tetratricopeptide (TPR) repeat protein